jgi:hypothetical protein
VVGAEADQDRFESFRQDMELLTNRLSAGLRGNNMQNISAIHQLRTLMEDVEEIISCSVWR